MYKFEELEIKRQKRIDKKNKIVEDIIDALKDDLLMTDCQEYIWNLCRESLLKRTNKELLQINA